MLFSLSIDPKLFNILHGFSILLFFYVGFLLLDIQEL